MTPPPPRITDYVLRLDSTGAAVWSLQKALGLTPDATFGPKTKEAVASYQAKTNLTRDGIAGGATQQRLVRSLVAKAEPDLPKGLPKSLILGESGGWIGAVNWSVPGGVDLGYCQRRVYTSSWQEPWPDYGAQFYAADLERAYDSLYQIKLLCTRLRERHDVYYGRKNTADPPQVVVPTHERAWRLAVLSHNYPAGADRLSRTKESDLTSYWTTPQKWVVNIGAHFPDGTVVQTPLQWCQRYSLGNAAHNEPGQMVKDVEW